MFLLHVFTLLLQVSNQGAELDWEYHALQPSVSNVGFDANNFLIRNLCKNMVIDKYKNTYSIRHLEKKWIPKC